MLLKIALLSGLPVLAAIFTASTFPAVSFVFEYHFHLGTAIIVLPPFLPASAFHFRRCFLL